MVAVPSSQLVITTLRTVTHNRRGLEQITLVILSGLVFGDCEDVRRAVGETAYRERLGLYRFLA